jgi:hypothetical protein
MSAKVFVNNSIREESNLAYSLCELKWQQKFLLTFGVYYLVFSHWPIRWKEQTWFLSKFSSYCVASCIVVRLDGSKASMSSSSFVLWPNEVYILGHIFSGPSKKHEGVKIDPSFLIWSLLYLYGYTGCRLFKQGIQN